jgi:hypothetical protein
MEPFHVEDFQVLFVIRSHTITSDRPVVSSAFTLGPALSFSKPGALRIPGTVTSQVRKERWMSMRHTRGSPAGGAEPVAPTDAAVGPSDGSKPSPLFAVGPFASGPGETVLGSVTERSVTAPDGKQYQVLALSIEAVYVRPADGESHVSGQLPPRQRAVFEYVYRKCGEQVFDIHRQRPTTPEETGSEHSRITK